ncbi:unnamed protein product [Peniophora sp. CBMAI 1063]|nr:unnamed protein product [Peniophora sp. CBMAI 1063]
MADFEELQDPFVDDVGEGDLDDNHSAASGSEGVDDEEQFDDPGEELPPVPFSNDPNAIWDHDSVPGDGNWGTWNTDSEDFQDTGLSATPYLNDHFGVFSSRNGWLRLSGWEYLTYQRGAHIYTTLEEKQAIPTVVIGAPSDPGTWPVPNPPITRLNDDLLRLVFSLLGPGKYMVPIAGFYNSGAPGRRCLDDVISVLKVGRWWNHSMMGFHTLWATFLPAAKHEEVLDIILERAGGSNLRVAFWAGLPPDRLSVLFSRASAIYATDGIGWRAFDGVFAGKVLPKLDVLYLRPFEQYMPRTVLPSHSGSPLHIPNATVVELSSPLDFMAPNAKEVGLSYHTLSQLETVLRPELSPTRLVINRPRELGAINWTALVARLDYSRLRYLRIRALDSQAVRIDVSEHARLLTPELSHIDLTTPVALKAPQAFLVKTFNILVQELIFLLEEMPVVRHLYVRWSASPLEFVGLPRPLLLSNLSTVKIAGDISRSTLTFVSSIRAPALTRLNLFGRLRRGRDDEAARALSQSLQTVLSDHPNDQPVLLQWLRGAHVTLAQARYQEMADTLASFLYPEHGFNDPPIEEVRATALGLADTLAHTLAVVEAEGPSTHDGYLLRDIVRAMQVMASRNEAPLDSCDSLRVRSAFTGGVLFDATLLEGKLCMSLFMVSSYGTLGGWDERSYDGDSSAYRVARALFGLQPLRPRVLDIVDEPFSEFLEADGHADMDLMIEALASYDVVHTLALDYSRTWRRPKLIFAALRNGSTLPGLKNVAIRCTVIRQPDLYPEFQMSQDLWFLITEMLRARAEAGRRLDVLALHGAFCMRKALVDEAEPWVGMIDLSLVECKNLGGQSRCGSCRWR